MVTLNPEHRHQIEAPWALYYDPERPLDVAIARDDQRYFWGVYCRGPDYGQFALEEASDPEGFAGSVVPIIRQVRGRWYVLCTYNKRVANGFGDALLEGARASVSNQRPPLQTAGLPIKDFPGFLYSNSARIKGELRTGVAIVTDLDYKAPQRAEWVTLSDFAIKSTDSMTMAVLFKFRESLRRRWWSTFWSTFRNFVWDLAAGTRLGE
jgi:hypothetical protein